VKRGIGVVDWMPGCQRPFVIRVQWLKAKSINVMQEVNYEKTLIGQLYE
jgi:hypothetical protein